MLVNVVNNGTGKSAQIVGVDVAGKTGTAQTTDGSAPHAWFVAFAPAQDAAGRRRGRRRGRRQPRQRGHRRQAGRPDRQGGDGGGAQVRASLR